MPTLTLSPPTAASHAFRPPQPRVYVNGRRMPLDVLQWEALPAPQFGRAVVAARYRGTAKAAETLHDPRLPAIGAEVRICAGDGGAELLGEVTGRTARWGGDGARPSAEITHRLFSLLASPMESRWQARDGALEAVEQAHVRFNTGEDGYASRNTFLVAGRETRVFAAEAEGQSWTVADALAYLLACGAPQAVDTPSLEELEELAGELDLGPVDATGRTTADALAHVAHWGGLELRAARQGLGLIAYRPGRQGRRRRVAIQPAGQRLSTIQTNLLRGEVSFERRPGRRGLLALGARKRYESTFALSPGWDASLETDRWRDFVRSESDQWEQVGDVYRKWVLNEHGWYGQAPWELPTEGFSAISEADFTADVPRRFLPCLSSDESGQSLGVVVEVRLSPDDDWQRWRGPLWCSPDECAVYLGGDALPAEYFQAAVDHSAQVRVTAVVEADARLRCELEGDPNVPRDIVDLSSRAHWRKVHATSIFAELAEAGQADERDDSALLERVASRHGEATSRAAEGRLVLGWADPSFHVGDLIERIDGRPLDLCAHPDAAAFVQAVRHDFQDTQTTTLTVMA